MSNITLFGFPRSTFVKVAGLILTARNGDYRFKCVHHHRSAA